LKEHHARYYTTRFVMLPKQVLFVLQFPCHETKLQCLEVSDLKNYNLQLVSEMGRGVQEKFNHNAVKTEANVLRTNQIYHWKKYSGSFHFQF
jgi:hypothetical protein